MAGRNIVMTQNAIHVMISFAVVFRLLVFWFCLIVLVKYWKLPTGMPENCYLDFKSLILRKFLAILNLNVNLYSPFYTMMVYIDEEK